MKRRVVVFAPGLTEVGGAARRSSLLVHGLAANGWDVRVVTRAGTLRKFEVRRSKNLTVFEIPGFGRRRLGALLFLVSALPLGLLWGRRALAFVAIQLFSQSSAAAVCGALLRRPFVVMGTISGASSEVAFVTASRFSRLRRSLLRRTAVMVAQSEEMASEMEQLVPADHVTILPNPVRPIDAPELNGLPQALYAGRLSKYKDLFTLLDAWRLVLEQQPDARLILVGAGGDYLSVEAGLRDEVAREPSLASSVIFTGWVDDVAPYFRRTDVFVLPSISEGMSNSLVEACAWKRIVVASDIGPNTAVLGADYRLLFKVGDRHALADALCRAFTDDESRARAQAQIEQRISRFALPDVVARLEGLILNASHSTRH